MTEQALSQRAVKTFNNGLISVNFGAPTTNLCFVVFHFLGHASHELTARVNLQRVWPSQKAALVGGCLFFDAAQPAVLHPQVMAGKSVAASWRKLFLSLRVFSRCQSLKRKC